VVPASVVTSKVNMGSLLEHLNKQPKYSLLARAYLTVALITLADYLTGPDPTFFILYLFPIIVISWYVSKKHGLYITSAAAIASMIHDVLFIHSSTTMSSSDLLTYWGLVQRTVVFFIVSITVSAQKSSEEKKRRLEYRIARQVQSFLVPRTAPTVPHFSCHAFTKASDHLSGDLFDFPLLEPNELGIIIGDVCGKGISAALLMAYLQGALRSHTPLRTQTLGSLMRNVNQALYTSTAEDKFATLFIGVYDGTHNTLTYVNAGHEPPMVFRRNGVAAEHPPANSALRTPSTLDVHQRNDRMQIVTLEPGDLILGVDPSAVYTPRVHAMNAGDILMCKTDGVEEARNHLGEFYGLERLTRLISANWESSPKELQDLIMKDIEAFVGMEPQYDDMTLVIGKVV
jgi:serine phosphatase RsbU (regulator of sigma subunit)